jgi:geranylgeranyl transferase type-1 subunit beta
MVKLCGFYRSLNKLSFSFKSFHGSQEADIRFVYCAFAVCHLLDGWEAIDLAPALEFIRQCRTFDGAYSQVPCMESHGGSTYCALASLSLAGKQLSPQDRKRTIRWLVRRQQPDGGLAGRVNKPSDSCYSFWIGASLQAMRAAELLDSPALSGFLAQTKCTQLGGFGKEPGDYPGIFAISDANADNRFL